VEWLSLTRKREAIGDCIVHLSFRILDKRSSFSAVASYHSKDKNDEQQTRIGRNNCIHSYFLRKATARSTVQLFTVRSIIIVFLQSVRARVLAIQSSLTSLRVAEGEVRVLDAGSIALLCAPCLLCTMASVSFLARSIARRSFDKVVRTKHAQLGALRCASFFTPGMLVLVSLLFFPISL